MKKKSRIVKAAFAAVVCALAAAVFMPVAGKASASPVSPDSLWENVKFASVSVADSMPEYLYDLPEGATSDLLADGGVRVNVLGAGSTVKYKNVVNVNSLTKDDVFMQIAIDPSMRGAADFKQLYIKLIDADDEDNYVTIDVHHSQWSDAQWPITFYQVGTKDIASAGLWWGYYKEGESEPKSGGAGTNCYTGSFVGNAVRYNGGARPITLRYDNKEKAFYFDEPDNTNNMTVHRMTILDLDDPLQVGAGNEWKGFARGRVRVEITATDMAGSSGAYVVTSFMGNTYGGDVTDVKKPVIFTEADTDPKILTAVKGEEYPLFAALSDDEFDGTVTELDRYIVYSGTTERVKLNGDSFIPTVAGEHTLIYERTDAAGNVASSRYALNVLMTAPEMSITTAAAIPGVIKAGETIVLPEPVVIGGSGTPTVAVKVKRVADNAVVADNETSFTPSLSGSYEIVYAATDYLKKTATVSYFIDVVRSSSPIATFPTLPEMMIAGKKIELPAMKSYDYYSSPAHPVNATVNVYVSETEGVRGEKIDRLYTPAAGSGERTVYFTYETYCAGNESDALTRVYPVVVRDATFLTDYFVKRGVTASGDDGSIGFTATADGAGMKFVHALPAKDFETMFSINSAKNAFTSFTVTFTDSVNPAEKLTLSVERNDGSKRAKVRYRGVGYEMYGSFGDEYSDPFLIRFDTAAGKLYDQGGRAIMPLTAYDDGSEYKGFTSGKFYVAFEFGGVYGESEIVLNKLGNQAMYVNREGDEAVAFEDYSKPVLSLESELVSSARKYDRIYLPACGATDAIDPYLECYVTVTLNGKRVLPKTRSEEGGLDFVARDYGTYYVTYEATDYSGNPISRRFYISVPDDVPPTITVAAPKESVKAGGEIALNKAVALDLNSEPALYVFLISPTGAITDVTGKDSVKTEKKGVYTVRYYAYDADRNATYVDFKVKAE